jgi:hypothetical protein
MFLFLTKIAWGGEVEAVWLEMGNFGKPGLQQHVPFCRTHRLMTLLAVVTLAPTHVEPRPRAALRTPPLGQVGSERSADTLRLIWPKPAALNRVSLPPPNRPLRLSRPPLVSLRMPPVAFNRLPIVSPRGGLAAPPPAQNGTQVEERTRQESSGLMLEIASTLLIGGAYRVEGLTSKFLGIEPQQDQTIKGYKIVLGGPLPRCARLRVRRGGNGWEEG